jgi:hypothetical protein
MCICQGTTFQTQITTVIGAYKKTRHLERYHMRHCAGCSYAARRYSLPARTCRGPREPGGGGGERARTNKAAMKIEKRPPHNTVAHVSLIIGSIRSDLRKLYGVYKFVCYTCCSNSRVIRVSSEYFEATRRLGLSPWFMRTYIYSLAPPIIV